MILVVGWVGWKRAGGLRIQSQLGLHEGEPVSKNQQTNRSIKKVNFSKRDLLVLIKEYIIIVTRKVKYQYFYLKSRLEPNWLSGS